MATNILNNDSAAVISIPAAAARHEGFRAWARSDDFPQTGQISFLGDQVWIDMSPEELVNHNQLKVAITTALFQLCRQLNLGDVFGDGVLLSNETAGLSTEPDALFVTWEGFRSQRVKAVPRTDRPGEFNELEGSPDWVLEVVSRSSRVKDTRLLRASYHAAGIREYWLVDPLGQRVDFKLLVWKKGGYVEQKPAAGWYASAVFGHKFQIKRQRNPLGNWQYTLLVRE